MATYLKGRTVTLTEFTVYVYDPSGVGVFYARPDPLNGAARSINSLWSEKNIRVMIKANLGNTSLDVNVMERRTGTVNQEAIAATLEKALVEVVQQARDRVEGLRS